MTRALFASAAVLGAVALAATGCGGGDEEGVTDTETPTETAATTPTATTPAGPQIRTVAGVLTIHRVQFSKYLPPRCNLPKKGSGFGEIDVGFAIPGYGRVKMFSDDCYSVRRGHRFLIVWLSGKGDRGTGGRLRKASADRLSAAAQRAYVRAGSGGRRETAGITTIMESPRATRFVMSLAFTPRSSARDFTLFWPKNPSVPLGK